MLKSIKGIFSRFFHYRIFRLVYVNFKKDPFGLIKTIWFNFHYLPFSQAFRLPVFLSSNTKVGYCRKGFYHGCGQTGDLTFGIIDRQYVNKKPSLLRIYGEIFTDGYGMHAFGPGAVISINHGAKLILGNNFAVSFDLRMACAKCITIGNNNMWSYCLDVRDTDGHVIYDDNGIQTNKNEPIVIGDNVWIGCRSVLLKGVTLPDNMIIASSSVINKSEYQSDSIITSGGKILKKYHHWSR